MCSKKSKQKHFLHELLTLILFFVFIFIFIFCFLKHKINPLPFIQIYFWNLKQSRNKFDTVFYNCPWEICFQF